MTTSLRLTFYVDYQATSCVKLLDLRIPPALGFCSLIVSLKWSSSVVELWMDMAAGVSIRMVWAGI